MVEEIRHFFEGHGENKNENKNSENSIIKDSNSSLKNLLNDNKAIFFPRSSDVGVLLLHSYTSTPYEFADLAMYLADKDITAYVPTIAGHGTTPDDLAKTTIDDWQKSAEDAYLFLKDFIFFA